MAWLDFFNDITRAHERVEGSDGRLNVSSRVDDRAYYVSRDNSLAFSLIWKDAVSSALDYLLYWKNTDSNGRALVIGAIGVNAQYDAAFELYTVTGAITGGVEATPVCLNRTKPLAAAATARKAADSGSSPVIGFTEVAEIDHVFCKAGAHEEFRVRDQLRIEQDGAIVIKLNTIATDPGITSGIIFGFYE